MAKRLIIMQGRSGAGKTVVARTLARSFSEYGIESSIISTDKKFIQSDGRYVFDPLKLGEKHREAVEECERVLVKDRGPYDESVVIVDNTNRTVEEARPYVELAHKYGCDVQIITVQRPIKVCQESNVHGTPADHRMYTEPLEDLGVLL